MQKIVFDSQQIVFFYYICNMVKRISPMWQLTREQLLGIVEKSNTISEALNKIGLDNKGGNFKTFNRVISFYDIDVSHFTNGASYVLNKLNTKKPINELLVKNSSYNRSHLKKRLIENGMLKNTCSICGLSDKWNGLNINMILDHKNGISNDNRIENLRMVCPNCNSQLDTHCGKHKKRKKYFCECGVEITKASNKCIKCSGIDKRVINNRPNKEELVSLIEQFGYSGTGRIYGVSGNAVKKWLLNFGE